MRFWQELWGHRRDLGGLWWRGLGAAGLSRERFHGLPPWQQRAGKVALGGLIAFLISIFINILERSFGQGVSGSIFTFDGSAYIAFGVVALLIVPDWTALPVLPLRVVLPAAALIAGLGGLITALATSSTRNGILASVGLAL